MNPSDVLTGAAAEPADSALKGLRRDAAENRRRLLSAAEIVFAELGLEASVDEVARVAGVGMGTLYRRFPTKDALIGELVRELLLEVHGLARDALAVPDGRGLEQYLYATARAQYRRRGCLARLWEDTETTALKEECRALVAQLLEQAQEHGAIRDDVTSPDIDLIFWALRGIIAMADGADTPAWERHLAIVLAGLRPGAAALPHRPLTDAEIQSVRRRNLATHH
jgi:AcrR family transcriptional regulator